MELHFPRAMLIFIHCRSKGELPWHEEMMRRSIIGAGRLGVSWLVLHPFSAEDKAWYSHRESLDYNVKYMKRYEMVANAYPGLGLAIENMVESREKRRFGSSAEDLMELYAALGSEKFGLCWDFGHAERSGINQCESLKQMGKLLKATHVEDTNGLYFGCDHLLPYVGMTDWDRIMPVLRDIGYEGILPSKSTILPVICRRNFGKRRYGSALRWEIICLNWRSVG